MGCLSRQIFDALAGISAKSLAVATTAAVDIPPTALGADSEKCGATGLTSSDSFGGVTQIGIHFQSFPSTCKTESEELHTISLLHQL